MVAVTAVNSATPSLPLQRVDAPERQAQREAAAAQVEAKVKRQQADRAELESSMRNLAARLQQVELERARKHRAAAVRALLAMALKLLPLPPRLKASDCAMSSTRALGSPVVPRGRPPHKGAARRRSSRMISSRMVSVNCRPMR